MRLLVAAAAVALLVAAAGACGGGGSAINACPGATVMATCAIPATLATCRDSRGNTCLECAGGSPGCIYDPSAPIDGGTAVCVAKCSDCGADCAAMK